jgi:predicted dehydrogenase
MHSLHLNSEPVGMAVVGAGYWGPNLARNIALNPATALRWVCDLDVGRAERLAAPYAGVRCTAVVEAVLDDPLVEAVAIATPAATHADLAIACLRAGKHVLVEKPLAASVADAQRMIEVADREGRIIMCDHTYCYSPAVRAIAGLVQEGELGDVLFIDSVRINLGLVQPDVDVLWDLAPHDLSILDFVLPTELRVDSVAAQGADPLRTGRSCIGYLTLALAGGTIAHLHVNWLSPTKVRTMIVGGSRRTLIWDDLNPAQRVSIYDRGVDWIDHGDLDQHRRSQVAYRLGDMVAPALRDDEPLARVVGELAAAARGELEPVTSARSGLRVLQVLEAASESLRRGGIAVAVQPLGMASLP